MSSFVYHAVSKAAPRKSLACPKGLRADLAAPDIVAPPDRSGHRSSAPELKFHASTLLLRSATVLSSSSSIKAFYVNSLWRRMNPSPTGRQITHKPLTGRRGLRFGISFLPQLLCRERSDQPRSRSIRWCHDSQRKRQREQQSARD